MTRDLWCAERPVAALCVQRESIYHRMPCVDAFDADRDARSFAGGMPVVAHPPCRGWSLFLAHQAKPAPGEMELGLWCAAMLRECGGVLEQPAFSRLFRAAGLPHPGEPPMGGVWAIEVSQWDFGFPTEKRTWLALAHIQPESLPPIPHRDRAPGGEQVWLWGRRRTRGCVIQNSASANARSRTTLSFAQWLTAAARSSMV